MITVSEKKLDRHLINFVNALRGEGLNISVDRTLEFGRAIAEIGFDTSDGVYWSGRATLLACPEDIPTYDEVFRSCWLSFSNINQGLIRDLEIPLVFDDPSIDSEDSSGDLSTGEILAVRYSRTEVLANKDFADCTEDELSELYSLMTHLKFSRSTRICRRLSPAVHRGKPDLRRTIKSSLRTGGEVLFRSFLESGERQRKLVLLLDVSGSMEPYARAFIRFVHAAIVSRTGVEAFTLGTRLTRLTRELSTRDPTAALLRTSAVVSDWSGGTRLGEGLKEFNDCWGVRGMARGADVVILSDGWDRGDPLIMSEQMMRLSRVANEVVWVNPLKATTGYEPLAQGMAAALPHVDRFISGHSLKSLEDLADFLVN